MSHLFPAFRKHYGPAANQVVVPPESIVRFSGLLPDPLLQIWNEVGWCSFANGFLWLVNPDDFSEMLADWAPPKDAQVVLRTAFGDMIYWATSAFHLVDVDYGEHSTLTVNVEVLFDYVLCPGDLLEKVLDEPIFKQALPRLGPPAEDECYGYVPAIGLGGTHDPANLKKVKLREHLSILAQLHE